MEEEPAIDIAKIHTDSWDKITSYFQKEGLLPPYLYTTTRGEAYKDMFASIRDSGVKQEDIPVTHALLYFYPGKIIGANGRPLSTNIVYGGTLIPEERIESDTEEELTIGTTRENVRNFLRYGALVYGIALPLLDYTRDSGVFNFLDHFEGMTSNTLTYEILQKLITPESFSRVLVRNRRIVDEHLSRLSNTSAEEEVKRLMEDVDKFRIGIEGYDRIAEWPKLLEVYGELYGNPILRYKTKNFYDTFKNLNLLIRRRNITGELEDLQSLK